MRGTARTPGILRSVPTAVVTGGAGFLGSHLCEHLLQQRLRVICLDNLETGNLANIEARDGEHQQALAYLEEARGLAENLDDHRRPLRCAHGVARHDDLVPRSGRLPLNGLRHCEPPCRCPHESAT